MPLTQHTRERDTLRDAILPPTGSYGRCDEPAFIRHFRRKERHDAVILRDANIICRRQQHYYYAEHTAIATLLFETQRATKDDAEPRCATTT